MLPLLMALFLTPPALAQVDVAGGGEDLGVALPAYPRPEALDPAMLPDFVSEAAITDVEAFYFDNDALGDVAVAWYYDDPANPTQLVRTLSIYRGLGSNFDKLVDIDLYRPSSFPPPLDNAVFDNGTGEIVVGDFDGDGDQDLAVLPFFSAELWFIENLGGGAYQPHYEYIFGQFGGGFLSPPEGAAADFDGDGRDDLVYVVNPTPNASGQLHFWRTSSSLGNMQRVAWEGIDGGVAVTDTLGLAVGNFDGDNKPDVAFTARQQIVEEPAIVIWHDFNSQTQTFSVQLLFPNEYAADVVAVRRESCGDDLAIDDRSQGGFVEIWNNMCTGDASFAHGGRINGINGTSPQYGTVMVAADLNNDTHEDILVRQRLATVDDAEQIQLLLWDPFMNDYYVDSEAFSTEGLENLASNQILRPRSLAVLDMMGSDAAEIIAGFSGAIDNGLAPQMTVRVWPNGCAADADRSGDVGISDLAIVLDPENMNGDINRDGSVNVSDLSILLSSFGCRAIR